MRHILDLESMPSFLSAGPQSFWTRSRTLEEGYTLEIWRGTLDKDIKGISKAELWELDSKELAVVILSDRTILATMPVKKGTL